MYGKATHQQKLHVKTPDSKVGEMHDMQKAHYDKCVYEQADQLRENKTGRVLGTVDSGWPGPVLAQGGPLLTQECVGKPAPCSSAPTPPLLAVPLAL